MKKLFYVAKTGVWLSLIYALGAQATVLMALDLESLTQKADMVIRAKVVSAQAKSREGKKGKIVTEVELKLLECWKGACPEAVTALVIGGQSGGVEQKLSGAEEFTPGEECVVFLRAHGKNRFRVLGMAQGKYRVEWTPDGREPIAVPESLNGAELVYSKIQALAHPLREEIPLSLLRQRIRAQLSLAHEACKAEGE